MNPEFYDINYSETINAEPEASSMIETFRAYGYSFDTALADIVDNSITAGAKKISLRYNWDEGEKWFAIQDDGHGMTDEELVQAMRPGSKNPSYVRNPEDLGRFGLGLKTASFSQCRRLTVFSKIINGSIVSWTWDIDHINRTGKWELVRYKPDVDCEKWLAESESGTVVLWEKLDRLLKLTGTSGKESGDKFAEIMSRVRAHLSMVFHRFLQEPKARLTIAFGETPMVAWDPFLIGLEGLQTLPEERLQKGAVSIKGYILPHRSKLADKEYQDAGGPNGWNEQQGYYIYRNDRMLVAGDWLGMFRKEDHYKLARIAIDLPNTLDNDWQIDIKKSTARPPWGVKGSLEAIARKVRSQANEVFRQRAKVIQRQLKTEDFTPVWQDEIRKGKRFYKINREHHLIALILEELGDRKKDVEQLMRVIEETIPVPNIFINEKDSSEPHGQPFENALDNISETEKRQLIELAKKTYHKLLSSGRSPEYTKTILLGTEPFSSFPELVETLFH
jgi:Histidine kinase-, DNA gyrase B-, and HSP90-like ATPase